MGGPDWQVKSGEQLQTIWRDSDHYCPPILGFAASRDEAALLQTVEQPRDIWVTRNHPAADFAAGEPFRRAAQDSENIVLRRRKVFGLEHLRRTTRQYICGAQQLQEDRLFRTDRWQSFAFRLTRYLHGRQYYSL